MQNQPSSLNDDELDFMSIGNKILKVLLYPFQLLLKYPKISTSFLILSIIAAFLIRFTVTPTFRSSFIIKPNDKTEKFHLKILYDLSLLIKEKNYKVLADELKLNENEVKSIISIEAHYPAIKVLKDTVNCTEVFIETKSTDLLIPIQTSILNYLENNPYFLKIHQIVTSQIEIESKIVDQDLLSLDSLKALQLVSLKDQKIGKENLVLLNELINPTAAYVTSSDRLNKKLQLLARSNYTNSFQLVKGCLPFIKPYWPPRLLVLLIVLIPSFLILCFFYLVVKEKRNGQRKLI